MYHFLLILHSILRWVITLLLITAILRAFSGMRKGRPFNAADNRTGLFLLIAAHLTLLIGLYQWLFGPLGLQNIIHSGMKTVMENNYFRFFSIEHLTGMV